MRKTGFIIAVLAFGLAVSASAAEKVRLVTDKDVYVAGDLIWCSASCFENGSLSNASAVAYVELVSSDGVAATAKLALVSGRGSGVLVLPASIPTGNYKIFAFTSLSESAETRDIAIFNTVSGARVRRGVTICDDILPAPAPMREIPGNVTVRTEELGDRTYITLRNDGSADAVYSVSVYEDDGLRPASSKVGNIRLVPRDAESDGEIVRALVYGRDAARVSSSPWLTAIISSPGSAADTYTGKIGPDGIITFKTNNIYGYRDLVCEILGLEEEKLECHFSPVSPFIHPDGLTFEPLRLSPKMREALVARNEALLSPAQMDTLYCFLPKRDNLLLSREDCISYHLDDYTRFNTVEDIILELIPNVAVRKARGHKQIKMVLADALSRKKTDNVLVLIDGVPVSEHERLLAYDAMALSDVYVYPFMYAMGKTVFSGVINFTTTRHDMSALQFDDNVRILDFQGCSYPVALGEIPSSAAKPAGRTLLWQPLVEIPAGGSVRFSIPAEKAPLVMKVTALEY